MSLFDDYDEDFPEAEMLTQDELKEVIEEENIVVKAYKRRKCGRKKLADNLERVPIYHDIPEEEKTCGCGAKLVKIGERYTEKLNIIPERIYVEKHIYPVYACRVCEGSGDEDHPVFRQAPAVKNIIPQGIATPGLLSYIFINKYCNHVPYYRQSKNFKRKGIELSRATMDKWQLEVYEKLKPLEKIMLEHVKTGKVLNMQRMYFEENRLREKNLPDSEFIEKRKKNIKPIMDEFYNWMIDTKPTVPESFKFGKALDYAIKSWPHLMNYLDCPEIYLDNSIAERSIRPYVLSRKNFLFCGSEDGARSTCLLFSLIESAIINDINSEEYLSSIFELAADTTDWTDSKWSELLPWNIKLIKKSDVSTVLIEPDRAKN